MKIHILITFFFLLRQTLENHVIDLICRLFFFWISDCGTKSKCLLGIFQMNRNNRNKDSAFIGTITL